MKGIVFTEFIELVESRFSLEIADRIIEAANLPSGGAYTSIGTYDHTEMIRLVQQLSAATGISAPILVKTFGHHLFGRFAVLYPVFFEKIDLTFDFLQKLENTVHAEVLKLYPDAELPRFECDTPAPERLIMIYRSPRHLADLAAGLIEGCIEHFGESIDVAREDLSDGQGAGVRFSLTKQERR